MDIHINGDLSKCVHDVAYIVSPLAGLSGGISWRPPAYSVLIMNDAFRITVVLDSRNVELRIRVSVSIRGTNCTA